MQKREIMATRYGEMLDMISCFAVYNGAELKEKKEWTFEEVMELR